MAEHEGGTRNTWAGAAVRPPMKAGSLARALLVTSGRAVALRAVPLACGVGIAATVLFAGNGLRAADVVAMMHGSLAVRAALWAAWTAAATTAIAPAYDAPGTRTLRSSRPPPALLAAMLLLLAVAAQLPWSLLFLRGGGAAAGALAALLAAAASASAFAASRARAGALLLLAVAGLIAADLPPAVAIAPAAALAITSARVAWRSALQQPGALRLVRRAPAPVALALAYLARMTRAARGRLQSAAVLVFAAGGGLALSLRHDAEARPVPRALLVFALPLSVACGMLAAPAVETEARLRPVLRATRTRALVLGAAMTLALATPSTALAAGAGAMAATVSHTPHTVTLASAAWAVLIAASVAWWARRAARARRPSVFLAGVVAIGAAFTAAAASW